MLVAYVGDFQVPRLFLEGLALRHFEFTCNTFSIPPNVWNFGLWQNKCSAHHSLPARWNFQFTSEGLFSSWHNRLRNVCTSIPFFVNWNSSSQSAYRFILIHCWCKFLKTPTSDYVFPRKALRYSILLRSTGMRKITLALIRIRLQTWNLFDCSYWNRSCLSSTVKLEWNNVC